MPPFQYTPFDPSGMVPSIAALIARSADPQVRAAENIAASNAHAQEAIAAANAHAREVSGDVWGRAISNIGQIPGQIMAQQREAATADQLNKLRQSQIDENAVKVKQQQKAASDQQLLGSLLPQFTKPDDMTGMNAVDHQGLTQAFVAKGGDPAAAEKYLQGAANTQEALDKITTAKRATATATAEAVGRQAKDARDPADFLTRLDHLTVAGALPQGVRDKFAQEVQQAGPEGWQAAQRRYVDWADSVVKPVTVKADETVFKGVSGEPLMTGPASRKTEAELAADAANPTSATATQSKAALDLMRAQKPRSEQEQALDAFAKSIGKMKAEDLSDADRQAFVKRDAQAKAETAFAQHVKEHTYDVAHPAPVKGKSQDELEQEGRGVLQREFSSRSGGLGTEDAKVNQAIHLVTLMDQYEGKPMPAQIHGELALGLARLTSPNGQVGIELEREFKQKTAEEGISKAVAYITGDPTLVNATPEKLRDMLRDSITRQGHVAEENRQTYLNAMLNLLPTQLEGSRRSAISKSVTLNKVDTVQMQAPNGQVKDVPRNQIEHFKTLGAKVIGG